MKFDFTMVLIYIVICVWKVLNLKTPIQPYMFFIFLFGMAFVFAFSNFLRKLFFDIKNMDTLEKDTTVDKESIKKEGK